MEDNKREIAALHEKNLQSVINEKTAELSVKLSNSNTIPDLVFSALS